MDRAQVARGPAATGTVVGSVVEFDEAAGYGTVVATDPEGRWFFHCTAIADGSRGIVVGTQVRFEVTAGRLGRFEGVNLRPVA
jgi:cold shock CspA family protein